jgi:ankyrin repeat protein
MNELANLIEAVKRNDLERVRALLDADGELARQRDETGATPLHYAAFYGQRQVVQLLLERGAELNCPDSQFGATPAGWAIEYLREQGGYLGIELDDLAYAIQLGDVRWVTRFLQRFPALRHTPDLQGRPFRQLAQEAGKPEIARLFEEV